MAVNISINGEILKLEIKGLHKVLSFKSHIEIPLDHVLEVYKDDSLVNKCFKGIRVLGINVPKLITAGTFYQQGDKIFWDVHDPEKAIIIKLKDENYSKLIIGVEAPEKAINLISKHLK